MYTSQELIKLWSNDRKRKAFVEDYKSWGIWFSQPELDLTFYKYNLPDGSKLIVMEYKREPHYGEKENENGEPMTDIKFYLHRDTYFRPHPVSGHVMYEHLMTLKGKLMKELKANAQTDA
jgi:hypothetical protein